jgi:hypothetical protein
VRRNILRGGKRSYFFPILAEQLPSEYFVLLLDHSQKAIALCKHSLASLHVIVQPFGGYNIHWLSMNILDETAIPMAVGDIEPLNDRDLVVDDC